MTFRFIVHRFRVFLPQLFVVALLLAAPLAQADAQRPPSSIIIRVAPGATLKSAHQTVSALARTLGVQASTRPLFDDTRGDRGMLSAGGLDRYMVIGGVGGKLPEMLAGLERSPLIEEAFENHVYRIDAAPDDSLYAEQWGLAKIEAEEAWKRTEGDSTVIIGVLDTGLDFLHPDLTGGIAINRPEDINNNRRFDAWLSSEKRGGVSGDLDGIDQDGNGYADDVIGYDFVDQSVQNAGDWEGRDGVPGDENGHGTNVAGVLGARRDNRIGIAGLAPGCRIVALRGFDAGGNGEDDDIAAAIVYAADRGVKVLNLSFGDYYYSPLQRDAIRYAYAKGVVIVASSGNEGGSDVHYPSSFPEVISVGATDKSDFLAPFTTFGSQLSLCAPGSGIITTALDSGYKQVSGTSFSAPYVSATAALLLSIHRGWNPDEVRSVLELSADDRGRRGWDLNYGAGRLNARRALEFPGPSAVAIRTPEGDAGFRGDTTISIIGSAFSPLIDSWQLQIGAGEEPTRWSDLTGIEREGRVLARLGDLRAADHEAGTHTLRLLVRQTDGRETERRVRLFLNTEGPRIAETRIHNVWRFQDRAVAVTVRTDQPTLLTLKLRRADSPTEPYRAVALEPERSGWVRNHFLFLTGEEMERGIPYSIYIEVRNQAGDTAMIGSPSAPLEVVRRGEAFSFTTLAPKSFALPYGYALNEIPVLFGDGQPGIALNRFENGGYDKLMIYSFDGRRFVARDSLDEEWIPRSFGDSDGDGLIELLTQARGMGSIYEQSTPAGTPLDRVIFSDTLSGDFWGDSFYDFDGDGIDEVIARTDNSRETPAYYYIARREGEALKQIARLENPTAPAPGDSRNKFGPPEAQVADFDGDGRPEILIGDDDGDFFIYERGSDGTFALTWSDENIGEGGSELVAAGDLDNDGKPEAIVAFHSRIGQTFEHDYEPPFWTAKVFRFDGEGKGSLAWIDSFAYVRPTLPFQFFSSIAAGNLDRRPGDEIAISIFPNLYVLTWDTVLGAPAPFWFREGAISNKPIIADFDRDGVGEIGVGDGEIIGFYQINPTFPGPPAPSGFKGWALNDYSAWLQWNPVPDADYYTLYRALRVPGEEILRFDSVARTTGTSIIDTGFRLSAGRLQRDEIYIYIVTTRDTSLHPDDSLRSNGVPIFTHNPARMMEATSIDERTIRVAMNFRMQDDLYRPGAFDVRRKDDGEEGEISTVIAEDRFTFLITLAEGHAGDTLEIAPTSLLRDFYDTPVDTTVRLSVAMKEGERPGERFIATRATLLARDSIAIDFNAPVDPATAAIIASYLMSPGGTIVSASVSPDDPRRVILVLRGDYPVGPTGKIYTITISDVRAADGRLLNDGAGSVVGFTIAAGDLAGVYVYPHPFSISRDVTVTFAGLTREAQVRIYTQGGRLLAMLDEREGTGGVQWSGEDAQGRKVPPGIYLYQVTGTTPDGSTYESAPQKIAVVP